MESTEEEEYAKLLQDFKNSFVEVDTGSIRVTGMTTYEATWSARIFMSFYYLMHAVPHVRLNNLVACFRIGRQNTHAAYCYLYSKEAGDGFTNMFLCLGGALASSDGEYRKNVQSWLNFETLCRAYEDELAVIENMIISRVSDGDISLHVDFFYPDGFKRRREFEDYVNDSRVAIRALVVCWFLDFPRIDAGCAENHLDRAYEIVMTGQSADKDRRAYDKVAKMLGDDKLRLMRRRAFGQLVSAEHLLGMPDALGQKIIPMTIQEAAELNRENILFAVWRELYYNIWGTNLVINGIAPSFAIFNDWFVIEGANQHLFDNLAMHDKYTESDVAGDIARQVKRTDRLNYVDRKRSFPRNDKFLGLSRTMHRSIFYANSNLRLTDLALCFTNEYVGPTMMDMPTTTPCIIGYEKLSALFVDMNLFYNIMFDYIYGFYCMNARVGFLHGDVHLNNITVYGQILYDFLDVPKTGGEVVAYVLPGATYKFKFTGFHGCVVDFSRAIMFNRARLENEYSGRFAEMFLREQAHKIVMLIHRYFPELAEDTRVRELIEKNVKLTGKILSAIDSYSLCTNMLTMVSDPAFKLECRPEVVGFLRSVSDFARAYVGAELAAAVADPMRDADAMPWPNLTILTKYFERFLVPPGEVVGGPELWDVYVHSREINYDWNDPDSMADMEIDRDIELAKQHGFPIPPDFDLWIEKKKIDQTKDVQALSRRYAEEPDKFFEPWMLT